jgi:hypothetical protein
MIPVDLKVAYRVEQYRALIEFLLRRSSTCTLVVPGRPALGAQGLEFLKISSSELLQTSIPNEWPGTKLLAGGATMYTFRTSPRFGKLLLGQAATLGGWMMPHLPEDPAFYRQDGSLLFGSIVHEGDAFAELTHSEFDECVRAIGRENILQLSNKNGGLGG